MLTEDKYILIGQSVVKEADLFTWAEWFEHADRRVMYTRLPWCDVSTVFLGLDHGFPFSRGSQPILFETMAFWFDDLHGGYEQERCSTWVQAEAMHTRMIREVSRPAAIIAALNRLLWDRIVEAREEWRIAWKEFRGVPLSEFEVMRRDLKGMLERRNSP